MTGAELTQYLKENIPCRVYLEHAACAPRTDYLHVVGLGVGDLVRKLGGMESSCYDTSLDLLVAIGAYLAQFDQISRAVVHQANSTNHKEN